MRNLGFLVSQDLLKFEKLKKNWKQITSKHSFGFHYGNNYK